MYKVTAQNGIDGGIYPEREEPVIKKADQWAASVAGKFAPWLRPARSVCRDRGAVNARAGALEGISDAVLEISRLLRQRTNEGYAEELVAQAFALVREVAGRTTGLRRTGMFSSSAGRCCWAAWWRRWRRARVNPDAAARLHLARAAFRPYHHRQ
jgi:hypothetical protein